jgi:glutaredoxin-like YruB-family protein
MNITVYSTPTCGFCHQIKGYLHQRGLAFRDVDVSRDPRAAQEMVRISGQQGVPVTVVNGQVLVGFDRPRLDYMLAAAARPKLGAAVADAATMAAQGRCQVSQGAFVGRVTPGSPAARAGLASGDVIAAVAGSSIHDAAQLEQAIARLQVGQRVPLAFVRDQQRHEAILDLTA